MEQLTSPTKSQRSFIFALIVSVVTAILNTLVASKGLVEMGSVGPSIKGEIVAGEPQFSGRRILDTLDRVESKIDRVEDKVRSLEKEIRK